MLTRPTFSELFQAGRDYVETLATELRDFATGRALWAITTGAAMLGEQVIAVVVNLFKASFVATAEGEDLDRRITDFGGPMRLTATAAIAPITVTRTSAVGDVTISAGTSFRGTAPNGATVVFETLVDYTLAAVASTIDIEATCTATGRDGNVPEDTLTAATGMPAGVSWAQDERAAGGTAEEADEAYRARYALFLEVQARGTVAALEYGARLVSGVTYAKVDADTFIDPDDGGYVAVYVGDPDAGSNSTLVDAVTAELENWQAAGIEVLVTGTAREERSYTIVAKKRAGASLTAADLKTSLIAYLDRLQVASKLYLSQAEGGVHGDFDDLDLLSVVITDTGTPSSREITPTQPHYAIRTAADGTDITVTLTEV